MFTGIVQDLGRVRRLEHTPEGARISIASALADDLEGGDSVAVNGVCVTALPGGDHLFDAEVMNETLARTSLGAVTIGSSVNLELALRASDRLGGHIVQGHVDGLATVAGVAADGFARVLELQAPAELLRYAVEKGSIALDGVSLTIASLGPRSFTVSLIPETLRRTTLGQATTGTQVNLEVDVLAKYIEKLVSR